MFKQSEVMHKWLGGLKGIEVGAASHNPFGLDTINVDYVQHDASTHSGRSQMELCKSIAHVDLIADACDIPVLGGSYDFVISSHVLEHIYSPIHALEEWRRIATKYVALIIPDKHRCGEGDKNTTIDDVIDRYKTYDPIKPEHKEDKHWTHWTLDSFLELCNRLDYNVVEQMDKDDKVGNGFLVIIDVAEKNKISKGRGGKHL